MEQAQIHKLPDPELKGKISLEEVIVSRRSRRRFKTTALEEKILGQLLWAGQGIGDNNAKLRVSPSPGAIYPMELFLIDQNGFFHYDPESHGIEWISSVDMRESLKPAALNQEMVLEAPLSILLFADVSKVAQKFIHHGIKYVHMEAGHVAQNILLQATALGLASVCIGGFDVDEVKGIFPIAEELEPMYIIPVGYPL